MKVAVCAVALAVAGGCGGRVEPTAASATPTTTAATTTTVLSTATRRATTTTRKVTTTTRPAATTSRRVAPTATAARNCDPSYPDVCLHDGIGDYDCAGGSGNGPNYVSGPIQVLSPDPFRLDADGDGVGCESP